MGYDAGGPVAEQSTETPPLSERVVDLLRASNAPLTRAQLRTRLHVNNHRLGKTLSALEADGAARRVDDGWSLAPPNGVPDSRFPPPPGARGTERGNAPS